MSRKTTPNVLGRMDNADDEMDNMETANLVPNNNLKSEDIPFCGCLSVRYYQPVRLNTTSMSDLSQYFDVNTTDVTSRLYNSFLFCRVFHSLYGIIKRTFQAETTFMSTIMDKPDAYGPFWVSFIGSFCSKFSIDSHNINLYTGSNITYQQLDVVMAFGKKLVKYPHIQGKMN